MIKSIDEVKVAQKLLQNFNSLCVIGYREYSSHNHCYFDTENPPTKNDEQKLLKVAQNREFLCILKMDTFGYIKFPENSRENLLRITISVKLYYAQLLRACK